MPNKLDGLENIVADASEIISIGKNDFIANIGRPGMYGTATQTRYIDASAPLVLEPVVPIVIKLPDMYNPYPLLQGAIKNLIETRVTTISGIDIQYTMDVAARPAGNDGQQMEVPIQTKRSPISPSFVIPEIFGNPVWNIFTQWAWDTKHPDSGIAFSRFENPPPYIPSSYSMSIMFIQFDPSHRPENIIDVGFVTNMFPKDPGGAIGMEKNIATSKSPDRTIAFSGMLQHNQAVRNIGKAIATELQLHKVDLNLLPPTYSQVSDAIKSSGISKELSNLPKHVNG